MVQLSLNAFIYMIGLAKRGQRWELYVIVSGAHSWECPQALQLSLPPGYMVEQHTPAHLKIHTATWFALASDVSRRDKFKAEALRATVISLQRLVPSVMVSASGCFSSLGTRGSETPCHVWGQEINCYCFKSLKFQDCLLVQLSSTCPEWLSCCSRGSQKTVTCVLWPWLLTPNSKPRTNTSPLIIDTFSRICMLRDKR